jgi:hypothetical protein
VRDRGRRRLAWGGAALCALAIFLTVPVARAVQAFAFKHAGRHFFSLLLLAVVAAGGLGTAAYLAVRVRTRRPVPYLWLGACAAAYVLLTAKYWSGAVEAAHFIEYGILGALLFRAWRFSIRDDGVFPAAFLTGSLVGTADEIIQWAVPGRYFDFPDIGINALGVGIVLLAIRQGMRLWPSGLRISPASARRVSALFAVQLVLFGLCLSNTPERTSALAARVPLLARLEKEEPMHEFINRHADPRVGTFFSRLTAEWLKKTDLVQARTNGPILKDWRDKDYAAFLASYNAVWTPFLYEMRIHLFRRDRYEAAGTKAAEDEERRQAWFVAAKENLILEVYFGRTLAESGYAWPAEKRRTVTQAVDLSLPYESPVSRGVLLSLSEKALWLSILAVSAALFLWNWRIGRRRPRKP